MGIKNYNKKKVEYKKQKQKMINSIRFENRIQTEPCKEVPIDTGFGPLRYEKVKVFD